MPSTSRLHHCQLWLVAVHNHTGMICTRCVGWCTFRAAGTRCRRQLRSSRQRDSPTRLVGHCRDAGPLRYAYLDDQVPSQHRHLSVHRHLACDARHAGSHTQMRVLQRPVQRQLCVAVLQGLDARDCGRVHIKGVDAGGCNDDGISHLCRGKIWGVCANLESTHPIGNNTPDDVLARAPVQTHPGVAHSCNVLLLKIATLTGVSQVDFEPRHPPTCQFSEPCTMMLNALTSAVAARRVHVGSLGWPFRTRRPSRMPMPVPQCKRGQHRRRNSIMT